jgi:hypothetical protein
MQSLLTLDEQNSRRASKSMISSKAMNIKDYKASANKYTALFGASTTVALCHLMYFQIC